MTEQETHVVTGAFGYSGRYIARRLLDAGHRVATLTNSMDRENPFSGRVAVHPLAFDDQDRLVDALRGAAVLYNTYWVRFDWRDFGHEQAVRNTLTLFDAARAAGVRRVVHLSITNPSEDSALPYFRGKARLERALVESGLSYAILRPTVLFGDEDILVHNIAWALRRLPVFGVFGDGSYRIQPIHVDDLARLAVAEGRSDEDRVVDAIGPETFTYRELVHTVAKAIGVRRPIVSVPKWLGYSVGRVLGLLVRDVVITREEIEGLSQGLLATDAQPVGETRLTDWVQVRGAELGRRYTSELARRRDRRRAYVRL